MATCLCLVTFIASGVVNMVNPEPGTAVEVGLTLGSALVVAVATLLAPPRARLYGIWSLVLLLAFAVLSALSVTWSIVPNESWENAGQIFAYAGVLAAGIMLARTLPSGYGAVLGGIALAAVVVCCYALCSKVFPGSFEPGRYYARLRAPYGYWNAVGATAAMGAICCLWVAARRSGRGILSGLAYPGLAITLVTLLMAYSRGALIALLIGLVMWFCLVPLRLRSALALACAGICAGIVVAYDFNSHGLTAEGLTLAERTPAGHRLGAILLVMVLVLAGVGIAASFLADRRPLPELVRRRIGMGLLAALACVILAVIGALAASHRGLFGTIGHSVSQVTNPNATLPANVPGRLTSAGSVRARYWKEALQVFDANPLHGTGARTYGTARERYSTADLEVRDAHGYIVQTLSDLGVLGLVVTLALLAVWMAAAGRPTHPFDRRWSGWRWRSFSTPYTPERIGMLAMLTVVSVFGIQSFADWTWFIPGTACVALLCAGWLAGRGPLAAEGGWELARANGGAGSNGGAPAEAGPWRERITRRLRGLAPWRAAIAAAVMVAALLIAWAQWEPVRSVEDSDAAETALYLRHTHRALELARAAVSRDPLSAEARFTLAAAQAQAGQELKALRTLQETARSQPANPQTWLELGEFEMGNRPRAALQALSAAIYLFPITISAEAIEKGGEESIQIHNDYVQAMRGLAAQEAAERAAAEQKAAEAKAREEAAQKKSAQQKAAGGPKAQLATAGG